MSRELDKLKKQHQQTLSAVDKTLAAYETTNQHLGQIGAEYGRVAEIYRAPYVVIEDIDRQFRQAVKLDGTDIAFLFLATALQCTRQYILANDKLHLTAAQGDELAEKTLGKVISQVKPEWHDVLFQSVPYDALKRGPHVPDSTGLSGTTHRYRTLGHDPVLGWVFGTANIMTNSLTKTDFTSYQVKDMTIVRHYPSGTPAMLDRFAKYASDDPMLLTASVARQAIHFGTDYFTTQGLPIPLITTLGNEQLRKIGEAMVAKGQISTFTVMRGAALSGLINTLIAAIHRLFYDEAKDGSRSLYEMRTRKILLTSNVMATGSNVIVTAFTKDLKLLDVGGMLITLHQLISDTKYINEIKRDFLKNELAERILGADYDFMEG